MNAESEQIQKTYTVGWGKGCDSHARISEDTLSCPV